MPKMLRQETKFSYLIDQAKLDGIQRLNVAVVIVNRERKLLICQRSAVKKFLPNIWHLPGGKVEADETIEEAITREIQEELNVNVLDILLDTGLKLDYIGHGNEKSRSNILLIKVEGQVKLDFENQNYQFIDINDLEQYFFNDYVELHANVFKFITVQKMQIESDVY
jgi:8-oxo-dGTP diphosphatase